MAYETIINKFATMGAQATVGVDTAPLRPRESRNRNVDYTIDINESGELGETFEVLVAPEAVKDLEITVPFQDKSAKHLVLAFRKGNDYTQYLCGHDERHWFVAALPCSVTGVRHAIEMLKPKPVVASQENHAVRAKKRNKRRNAGFIRQGEWFFIPAPEMDGRTDIIVHKNEPLTRGSGKPHTAQHLCRTGGETVYVSRQHQSGLTEGQYRHEIKVNGANPAEFRQAQRDASVFVKGRITHPDHKTVVLKGWHRVLANTETNAPGKEAMRFID